MMALLKRVVGRSKNTTIPVTVYTRQECCCCHKALDVLATLRGKHNLEITEVDIDNDPALIEAHGLSVPVVEIDGKIRFRGVVNPVLLKRLFAARGR